MKLTYRHVSKLIELLEAEVERNENKMNKTLSDFGKIVTDASNDEYISEEKRKFEKDIAMLEEIKHVLEEELDKVVFSFHSMGASQKPANEQQQGN